MADYFVHESAYIDQNVNIGAGTGIWHYSHIMSQAEIGENCILGQNIFVGRGVKIGNNCKIQNNVSVYEGVTLEDGVFCGPSCVFTNVLNPRSNYPKDGQYVTTLVRRGVTIGANATILCGVTIGAHAFIGAGSVVTTDLPDYALAYGVPAEVHAWICECGEKLSFQKKMARCIQCHRNYIQSSSNTVSLSEHSLES